MGDIKVAETFIDCVFITVTATGAPALLLAPTCTFVKASNNTRTAGTVVELGSGWYKCTDFVSDAAGTWLTEWAVAGANTIHYPYKEFKAGGGQTADIATTVANIHDTDLPDVHTDVDNVHTDVAHIHDTDLPDVHTDVGTCITAAGTAAAYAIVNSGQSFRGIVTNIPGANQFKIATLAGIGAGVFIDAVTPWYAYVLRDAGNAAALPQGETRLITGYTTADGTFTTAAFTAPGVELGDDIIIMSAYLSNAVDTHAVVDNIHDTDLPDLHTDVGTCITAIGDMHATDLPDIHTDIGTLITAVGDMHATDLPDVHTDVGTVHTDVDAVRARTDRLEITKTFFSPSLIVGTVDTSHTDIALGTVTLPNIAGTITHVYAGIKFRMVENTNVAANKLQGAQEIQVDTVDAINFVDHQFGVAASTREGGDCIIGYTDMVATVDVFNHGYVFVWDEPLSEVDSLVFNDIQVFLIVSYY